MSDSLYAEEILYHYRHPSNKGRPAAFDAHAVDSNPLCGDKLEVFLKLNKAGRVTAISFDGSGCAISQAAMSMLTEIVVGKMPKQLLALSHNDVLKLLGVPISPARMKCATLSLKVLKMAACKAMGTDGKMVDW